MENVKSKQVSGDLKISQDVIAAIARVAALEIEGVDSLAEWSSFRGIFSRSKIKKSISVELNDDFVNIGIGVNLKFGAKISEVCPNIQSAVKDNVQTMTGMAVSKVNVLVAGIIFPDDEADS